MYRADSLGFLFPIGTYDIVGQDIPKSLDLAHLTVCPPNVYTQVQMLFRVTIANAFIAVQRRVAPIRTLAELHAPTYSQKTKLLLGLQHPPIDANMHRLAEHGVRVTTIAYQDENRYAGGFAAPTVGLKEDGKRFMHDLEERGIILDLSHASHQTARDVLAYHAHTPRLRVMASHTGCHEIFPHLRNLPIDVLQGIAAIGGYVGIYTLTFGVDATDDSPEGFRRHLDFAVAHVDPRCLGIGSDGVYQEMTAEQRQRQHEWMNKRVNIDLFKARNPMEPLEFISPRKMAIIEDYLRQHGYEYDLLQGIIGKNFYDFLHASLPQAA